MEALAKKARVDTVLTTMFGSRIIDTHRAGMDPALRLGYGRGRPRPLFKGAAPKVILSRTPRARLVKIYEAHGADAAKAGLGKSWSEFREYLADVRREDFYWSHGELERGIGAAAVAVRDADGEAVSALALVGTNAALDAIGEARLRTLLANAREEIEAQLA
jgi:DNA-binding IclR family transcriptional regulator